MTSLKREPQSYLPSGPGVDAAEGSAALDGEDLLPRGDSVDTKNTTTNTKPIKRHPSDLDESCDFAHDAHNVRIPVRLPE